ncbi:succinyldiaminopimelate transaminase [Nocardioides sp. 1609]|uniref:succinyldiaminopimelate transaminase n=1 Tax=Nocardioides sp. 1609 TaxID=2508327 RepID=UPI002469019A|nr:succinyldiaminopimelate transaminase [Nocardioides sp. 1609]
MAVRRRAEAYPGPVVDLSIGAPTDPTPDVVRAALAAHADAPGYPLTAGRPALREAVVRWLGRVHGVSGLDPAHVLPAVGTKELIGSLPLHLGLGAGDVVAQPTPAYPTYAVGAALVGATTAYADSVADLDALAAEQVVPRLVWVNSPANPTGRVLAPEVLRSILAWCRDHGALLASDECYLDLGWDVDPVSVLHPDVCGGSHDGVVALHSLSKRSNLAGYRIGFLSGDPAVVAELVSVRRNLGLGLPDPQQGAAVAALDDDEHVTVQRARYARRRAVLRPALEAAGFRVDHSEAGLYLWATRDEPGAADHRGVELVGRLADLGLVAVAGAEYGAAGHAHVRLALTAPDDAVALAADRLIQEFRP